MNQTSARRRAFAHLADGPGTRAADDEGAGLPAYLPAARHAPYLSAAEESRLARLLRDKGDAGAAATLVLSHLRLVIKVARGYAGYGLPQADLIQEGTVGLLKAVGRFDPDRGVRLVSFAIYWILAEIHEYVLRNWRMVRTATTKAQRKLFFNLRSLRAGDGQLGSADLERIAAVLEVSTQDVAEMDVRLNGHDVRFDSDGEDGAGSSAGVEQVLADDRMEPSMLLAEPQSRQVLLAALRSGLSALDARSRRILECRWLAEPGRATLRELADEFSISAERVRQIEAKAIAALRADMLPGLACHYA